MATIRKFGRLRADSAIWFALAIVLFCAGAILTLVITTVGRHPTTFVLLFSGHDSTSPAEPLPSVSAGQRPAVAFEAQGRDLVLVIGNIGKQLAQIEFGPFQARSPNDVNCFETDVATVSAYRSPLVAGRLEPYPADARLNFSVPFGEPVSYRIDVAELERSYPYRPQLSATLSNVAQTPRTVQCRFTSVVQRDTFTSRSLDVVVTGGTKFNARTGNPEARYVVPGRVSAGDEDADEVRVTNRGTGQTLLGESISLPPDSGSAPDADIAETGLQFRWNSISAGELRDIIIVVIGTLIALGAAAAIEGGRPYIEALVEDQETGTS